MKSWGRNFVLGFMCISFILTGCGGGGGGGDSSPAVSGAPTGVTAVAGAGQVRISWDNVTGATSYNIYHSTTSPVSKATGTKISNVTNPSVVTPLTNGTTYYFVVTAVNAIGESKESIQKSATPIPNPPPAAPTSVSADAGPGHATISWNPVTGATSYNIYYSQTTGVTQATGTKISNVTSPSVVTSLTNGTTYYFVVTAANADGESGDSIQVSATPTSTSPPAPPTGVSAAPGPAQATINWSAVAGATSYRIYYSKTSPVSKATGIKILDVTSPNVVTSLTRGTPYYFVVTAVSAVGESAESSQVTAIPNPPNPTFSQGDLTGTWNVQVILTGVKPGWYRYTAVVDGSGNVTISSPSSSSGVSIPTVPAWSITPGTGFDNTTGVVTETGTGRNSTFQAKMSSNKFLMVGNSTYEGPGGKTFAEHIFLKQSGATFSDADLADKTIAYNRIFTGTSKTWEVASGTINASNQLTLTSKQDSSGVLTPPSANFAEIHVTPAGIVTITDEPNFIGMMSIDKKVIAGTSTDDVGKYSLRIIQLRGQTYTAADLAGVYLAYTFNSDQWARGAWTFTPTSATRVAVDATNIANSAGALGTLAPWAEIIDSQGGITIAPPGDPSSHGLISFWKDMVVYTGDREGGASMTITMQ